MKTATSCPSCGEEVSVWQVFAAPTPWQLRCRHCRARLRVRSGTLPLFLLALVVGGVLAAVVLWARDEVSPLVALLIAGVVTVVAEGAVGLWIVNRAKLESGDRPRL